MYTTIFAWLAGGTWSGLALASAALINAEEAARLDTFGDDYSAHIAFWTLATFLSYGVRGEERV
jgi:hypothetical protein